MKTFNRTAFLQKPSAILIDLDDTLYAYGPAHKKAMMAVQYLMERQFKIPEKQFQDMFAVSRETVKLTLGKSPSARSRLLYFQTMFEIMGLGSSVVSALNCEQTYWNTLMRNAVLFDGVRDFLDEARLNSIPLVLVTNLTAQVQFQKLVYFGLSESFDFILTSEQIGVEKPAPQIFQAAEAKIGKKADAYWMVGDDLKCDIDGAKKALGCITIAKQNERSEKQIRLSGCDAMFDDYSQLTKMLNKLSSHDHK
ncbi:MAG: HAD family hydrolase [Candidatus Puniceispirillaceae bacterium]